MSNECTRSNSQHNPSVICHEEQHDEEGIKNLHSIKRRPHNLRRAERALPLTSGYVTLGLGASGLVAAGEFADGFVAGAEDDD